jgi:hypothetical protein
MDFSLEIEGDVVICKIVEADFWLELLAEVVLDGRRCVLRGAHVQGPGANAVGAARLLRLARLVKEKVDVDELCIEGATRASGAGPGRLPAVIVFR